MTEKLPEVLAEIAELVGEVCALRIAAEKGGTRIYIPAQVHEAHWLANVIGVEKAQKLCEHFRVDESRGQRIEIPLYVGGTYRQFMRRIAERVHRRDEEDASSTVIAKELGISQRSVHRHRRRHRGRKNSKQGQLF